MAKPCLICAEPGVRDSVDRQLAEGAPVRDIAAVVDRSKSSISRHKLHGSDERDERGVKLSTPKAPTKLPGARFPGSVHGDSSQTGHAGQKIESREHLVDRFQSLLNEATEILTLARRRGDSRLALQALKEARESVISIGKALGLVAPDGQTLIDARRQSLAVLSGISEDDMRKYIAATVAGASALTPAEDVEAVVIDGAFESPADVGDGASEE